MNNTIRVTGKILGTAVMLSTVTQSCYLLAEQFEHDSSDLKSLAGWSLVWSDEFNHDSLNTTKWSHEVNCFGGGNNEQQCYTARQGKPMHL